MDLTELERLVEMVQSANIRELTLKQDGDRITIRKSVPSRNLGSTALVPVTGEFDETDAYFEAETALVSETDPDAPDQSLVSVVSPLVGVFHHIKPIVGLGSKVSQGQVVGVIEAMKLINEVMAPASGKVVDVLVDDGQPVEYGQELFAIQPMD